MIKNIPRKMDSSGEKKFKGNIGTHCCRVGSARIRNFQTNQEFFLDLNLNPDSGHGWGNFYIIITGITRTIYRKKMKLYPYLKLECLQIFWFYQFLNSFKQIGSDPKPVTDQQLSERIDPNKMR